jgi:N-acetyl sugar amidotransferase
MKNKSYQICNKTVMDTNGDPDITFDSNGVCNYYHEFIAKLKIRIPSQEIAKKKLIKIVEKIKRDGQNKPYDCIIGVSGGVDSTYTAWLVKKHGLRPLAVHLDNGWNSELAVKNIENILNLLQIDLYTEVLDWDMFKDLQLSFLKASTPDGEIPTDHAILAILYKVAAKNGIKHIISGMNFRSEGMLPPSWARGYLDWKYIKSVHNKFGSQKLSGYPHLTVISFLFYNIILKIRSISLLNYIDFKKDEAQELITKELGWKNYGGKHHESTYTKFYQSYILPKKFNIDKRKAHLSCLIMSTGEITREHAIEIISKPAYDKETIQSEQDYVLKKLGLNSEEFNSIMSAPIKTILDYPNNHNLELKFRKLLLYFREKGILPN